MSLVAHARVPTKPPELTLTRLILGLVASFGVLAGVLGAPPLPTQAPTLPASIDLELLVRSPSAGQLSAGLGVLVWAAWLAWSALLAVVALRIIVALGERVAAGAKWLRVARALSDMVTHPTIKRAIDVSVAGTLLLRVTTATVTDTAFAASPLAEQAVHMFGPAAVPVWLEGEHSTPATAPGLAPGDITVTVQKGDTLGGLGERFYGHWSGYKYIYAANVVRTQQDGRVFTDAGQIYEGWVLIIPQPILGVETDADGHRWYVVRAGDSLASIATHVLGNEARWPELFNLNTGATMPDGRSLTRPSLIWPGLRLRLPEEEGNPASTVTEPSGPSPVGVDPVPSATTAFVDTE